MLRTVTATRYVTPLREGGSLPGLVEADDDGLYVAKFRAAGQGAKALIAEVLIGEIGRRLGLLVPEIVLVEIPDALGRTEPDPEINELVTRSAGINCGIDFLPGALDFGAANAELITPDAAADIVWFDAFCTNVDRTPRNPNMLLWHGRTWLIDHGAALYQHHGSSDDLARRAGDSFGLIREHVLLGRASSIVTADARMASRLTADVIDGVVDLVPDAWLDDFPGETRSEYNAYLTSRLAEPRAFVATAEEARVA
jgi:hypothetical protein